MNELTLAVADIEVHEGQVIYALWLGCQIMKILRRQSVGFVDFQVAVGLPAAHSR